MDYLQRQFRVSKRYQSERLCQSGNDSCSLKLQSQGLLFSAYSALAPNDGSFKHSGCSTHMLTCSAPEFASQDAGRGCIPEVGQDWWNGPSFLPASCTWGRVKTSADSLANFPRSPPHVESCPFWWRWPITLSSSWGQVLGFHLSAENEADRLKVTLIWMLFFHPFFQVTLNSFRRIPCSTFMAAKGC